MAKGLDDGKDIFYMYQVFMYFVAQK